MKFNIVYLCGFAMLWSACSGGEPKRPPNAGLIAPDQGGAAGYQHGIDRSKFSVGGGQRYVNEFGFLKVVGSEGVFAVDAANGLAVATPNADSSRGEQTVWFSQSPEQHNRLVMDYFIAAGIPKEQVAKVHTTTSLTGSASAEQAPADQPKLIGYQSVLNRKIREIPVLDSVAWARLDDRETVLAEWVYWPAIPASAIGEASRMQTMLADDANKRAFLAKLPAGLPPGKVVIRHSSATWTGPFVAVASYDVPERRSPPQPSAQGDRTSGGRAIIIVRHFGADGNEFKLPQEKRNRGEDYPTAKRPPPNARPQ